MKTDACRLQRISEVSHALLWVVHEDGITADSLSRDYRQQRLVTSPLFNIGEQTNCLSSELLDAHPDQLWSSITGLRHRLVHHYESTNWSLIADVISNELDSFVAEVDRILAEMYERLRRTNAIRSSCLLNIVAHI